MALYDNLFEPVRVGPVIIPNRIVRAAHGTGLGGEALIAYHEARAKGGVGMSTLSATSVLAEEGSAIPLGSDAVIGVYEELQRRIRPHGMKLFQQIYHAGASQPPGSTLEIPPSVGETPNPLINVTPQAMTRTMIHDMVEAFGKAARRIRDGGIDGIDIHASSGYLIHEFLSPALNTRSDEYGGSLANRMRFLDEIIAAIRAEVGTDICVGIRLPNEDYTPGGLDAVQSAEIAQLVDDRVDYISLHMGAYWRFHTLISPTDDPLGTEMAANRKIIPFITKPRIVTGRIMTLDHASAIVREGEADLISMVRALMADPELVNKGRRAEEHRIRPCISTNFGCVGQLMTRGVISCVVNRASGAESKVDYDPRDRAEQPKKILIIGGGIAGMEAARNAALRGHSVELHEAQGQLGGQVQLARQAPRRGDVGLIADWLVSELQILGVDVRTNSFLDTEAVSLINADEIIVATGTTPREDGFQVATPAAPIKGFDLPHVYNGWNLFGVGRPVPSAKHALVFDDTGTYEAISAADMLLASGAKVTMVSRFERMGDQVPFPPVTVEATRERLMEGDFDFIGGHYLREITAEDVEIGVLYTQRSRRIAADTVVIVGFHQPNRWIYEALAESGRPAHMVGDVLGRRDMTSALHSAAEVGSRI